MVNKTKPIEATTMGKYYDKLIQISEELDKQIEEASIVLEDGENTIEISTDSLTDDQKEEILLDKGLGKKTLDNLKKDPKKLDGALTAVSADDVKQESGAVRLEDLDWDGPATLKYDNPNTPEWGGFYVSDKEWSADIQHATEFDSKEEVQDKIEELVASGDFDGDYLYIWPAKSKFAEGEDISEEVVVRVDDDDLDMHGYLKSDDGLNKGELEWTDDIKAAKAFQHEELGQNKIEAICNRFHYDPSTFKTISLDPRANEPYEDDEENNDNFGENWVSLDPMHPQATTLP